jgi:hypothetical protein
MRLKILIMLMALVLGLAPLARAHSNFSGVAGNFNPYISFLGTPGLVSDQNTSFIPFSSSHTRENFDFNFELTAVPPIPKEAAIKTPIPASLLLFGTGLLGLVLRRRHIS